MRRTWSVLSSSASVRRFLGTRVPVQDALESQELGKSITVLGWVTSVRRQKELTFLHIRDGSSSSQLQLLAPTDSLPQAKELNVGCSVTAEGELMESTHPSQRVELQVKTLTILGECDPVDYPFKARTRHALDYIRGFPHLRGRTNQFSSILRTRHTATAAIHDFFHRQGFIHCHTPILSSSDCEGAGEMFEVKDGEDFFGQKTFLTVSGQLHAEALMSGMTSVYTFGPTFRADKSHTRRHLAEFYMVEAETVTLGDPSAALETILSLIEDLVCSTVSAVREKSSHDVDLLAKLSHDSNSKVPCFLTKDPPSSFQRISYSEAIQRLRDAKESFHVEPKWGCDLTGEHEQYLLAHCDHAPLFVTDFPAAVKPFYVKCNEDSDTNVTAASVDLLLPGVGEVVGGTIREERYDVLKNKLESEGKLKQYQWYLDLRRFGSVPHGGFGLGFDRLLQAMLGLESIRDTIPFPRYADSCQY